MTDVEVAVANTPAWVDLSSSDAAASREFYGRLFGWDIHVTEDPQYGGYAIAQVDGKDAAGIGSTMAPGQPTAWMVYIGTPDAYGVAEKVGAAGGTVVAPPFDVGDQGRMAIFHDPSGAHFGVWQAREMNGFHTGAAGTFGWAELNSRGVDKAVPFYEQVFGWSSKRSPMGENAPEYIEFQIDGQSIAGGQEMHQMVPAEVPSYWGVYFAVADVDATFSAATEAGARELVSPMDFPGGRFAIVQDPQGAAFGLLRMAQRS